jgi:hypothetical protein
MKMNRHRLGQRVFVVAFLGVVAYCLGVAPALAEVGTDFPGIVLMVDPAAGKLAVKKDGGGTRFTFAVNNKTQFEGQGLKGLQDVKKGDSVTVNYQVTGSQYLALKVTKNK